MLLLWLSAGPARAEADAAEQDIRWSISVLADAEGAFTAADVLGGRLDRFVLPAARAPRNLGYPRHPYWVHIRLHNSGAQATLRELVLWRGAAHSQRAFELRNGQVHPLSYDLRTSRHAVLPIELAPGQQRDIAVRIDSSTALSLDYRLLGPNELADIDRVDYWFFGMLAGIVLAIAVYVVAIYFAVRERMYLYFAAFAGLNLVYQLHSEGYAYIL